MRQCRSACCERRPVGGSGIGRQSARQGVLAARFAADRRAGQTGGRMLGSVGRIHYVYMDLLQTNCFATVHRPEGRHTLSYFSEYIIIFAVAAYRVVGRRKDLDYEDKRIHLHQECVGI